MNYKTGSSQKRILDNSYSFKSNQQFKNAHLQIHNSYNNPQQENDENQNDENFLQQSIGAGGEINLEVNKKFLSFSPEQVLCMCEALQQKDDIEKLTTFLRCLPSDDLMMNNESILRARAVVAYHRNSFHELYALLESHCFSVKYHTDLQGLW